MEHAMQIDTSVHTHAGLVVNTFGHSETEAGHRFGPAVRSYYLIHFITAGQGCFTTGGITYHLERGQGFLISPDQQVTYRSDDSSPWSYVWVGFSGDAAETLLASVGLTERQPIFRNPQGDRLREIILSMLDHNHGTSADHLAVIGQFYSFLGCLATSTRLLTTVTDSNLYVNRATDYIRSHMAEPMTISEVASFVGLHRSYLSTVFKTSTGLSPLQYLQSVRLTKSKHLLETSLLSIAAIAYSCGFERSESFARLFKRRFGLSPAAYRRSVTCVPSDTRRGSDK
ncbi:MAG: AraC family transcriptional regulator [Lachnospiraceae bacterium]|nr:AraC family transcriptional regulator [Lachnospiraceae bacterium]MDY5742069.1 AraC family transcriptional regulator [Lachnospiraceae bacterium]